MFVRLVAAGLAALLITAPAAAQDWKPTRPVTMIVPFAAGGQVDVLARVLAPRLSEVLGQQVVVENVGGGGGMIGSSRVARGAPDGHLFVLGSISTHTFNQTLFKQPLYNVVTDFTPVALIAETPLVLVTRKTLPASNLKEFAAFVKANGEKAKYGSAGVGSANHLSCILLEQVKAGKFREDLFYRLHIFPITVPPLRDRMEDVPSLVRRFVARFAAEEGKRVRSVSADAMRMLNAHRWPGNVRQLENAVFRAVVLAESDEIGVAEFPQIATQVPGFETHAAPTLPRPEKPEPAGEKLVLLDAAPATAPASAMIGESLSLVGPDGHVLPMETIEAEAIRFSIERYRGRMTEVARRLKIGRSTLYRKLKDIGLDPELEEEEAHSTSTGVTLR